MVNGRWANPHRVARQPVFGDAPIHAGSARNVPEIRSTSVHKHAEPRAVETGSVTSFADDGAADDLREAMQ